MTSYFRMRGRNEKRGWREGGGEEGEGGVGGLNLHVHDAPRIAFLSLF